MVCTDVAALTLYWFTLEHVWPVHTLFRWFVQIDGDVNTDGAAGAL